MPIPLKYDSIHKHEREWQKTAHRVAQAPGILFDMGGGSPFQGYISRSDIGPDTKYFCLDVSHAAQPNIAADLLHLPLASESVDNILCNAVLEHVKDPKQAIDEMYRTLRRPGFLMVSVPFIYPYHDRVDYYRFTDTALYQLFSEFDRVRVEPLGDYVYSAFLFLTGFNFALVSTLRPLVTMTRAILYSTLSLWRRLSSQERGRDYLRSLVKSPVGWYVYCEKM